MSFFDRFRKPKPATQPRNRAEDMSPEDVRAEIVRCAHSLRTTASPASHHLANPIECEALASASVFTPLIAWAIFNPFGPTLCALHLVEVPNSKDRIIFFRLLNPFAAGATAYGLVPETVSGDPNRLLPVLMLIFERGTSAPARVIQDPPTHVSVPPESPLKLGQVKDLIFAGVRGTDSKALSITIERLRTYRGDPWKRTAVERDEAFARLGTGTPAPVAPTTVPATRAQLEEWWGLVTDPVHVQSEVRELPRAWEGAIKFQERMRQR
jgi:hypothetical protein